MHLVLTTYERYDYIVRSVNSLLKTKWPEKCFLHIYDDASENLNIKDFLLKTQKENNEFYSSQTLPLLEIFLIFRGKNLGCTKNTTTAIDDVFKTYPEEQFIVRLNDDAVYNPLWLFKMVSAKDILLEGSQKIGAITVFNTDMADPMYDKIQYRHRVIGNYNDEIKIKESCGAFSSLLNKEIFYPFTYDDNWDITYIDRCKEKKYGFFVTDKSYSQHIGIEGLHSRGTTENDFDNAKDFVGEE